MSGTEPPADVPAEEPASTSQDSPPDETTPQEEAAQPKGTGSVKWFSVTKGMFKVPSSAQVSLRSTSCAKDTQTWECKLPRRRESVRAGPRP